LIKWLEKGSKYFDNLVQKGQIRALKGLKISSFVVSFQKIIFRVGTALHWEEVL